MAKLQPQPPATRATTGYNQHPQYTVVLTHIEACTQLQVLGFAHIDKVPVTGKGRIPAQGKGPGNASASVSWTDDGQAMHWRDFITDEHGTISADKPASHADLIQIKRKQAQAAMMQKAKQQAGYEHIAREAAKLWHEGIDAPVTGYFASKGLAGTHGARWHERLQCWLLLVTDIDGTIYTIQKIYKNGGKRYLKCGRTAGGMVVIGSLIGANRVLVCEGFATGCTLREKTSATVVCALTCNNLLAVCTAIRDKYPSVDLVVCADDDRQTANNPGRTKAEAAAGATAAKVAYPPLCADCTCNDFNDAATCKRVAP